MVYVPALLLVRSEISVFDRNASVAPDGTDYLTPQIGDLVIHDTVRTLSGVPVATVKAAIGTAAKGALEPWVGVLLSDSIPTNTTVPPQGIGSGNTVMGGQPCTFQQTPQTDTTLGISAPFGTATPISTSDMVIPASGDLWRMIPSGWTGGAANVGGSTFHPSDFGASLAAVMGKIGNGYGTEVNPATYLTADATLAAGASGVTLTVNAGTHFANGQTITLSGYTTAGVAVTATLLIVSGGGTGTLVCTWQNASGDAAAGTLFDYDYASHCCAVTNTLGVTLWANYGYTTYKMVTVASVNPDGTLNVELIGTNKVP